MQINELNEYIRGMFKTLIENGFTKSAISEITLGRSFTPQFTKFIENSDLGLKPLTRMFEGLGYEIHIVPVKSDDDKYHDHIENKMTEFYQDTNSELLDYLDNHKTQFSSIKINNMFNSIIDELMDDCL